MEIALAFVLVIMSAITFMLGVNVFIYDDFNQIHNKHYVILCAASSLWSFCHACIGISSEEEIGTFFRCIAFVGILVVIAQGILLASYWTEMSRKFQKFLQIYVTIASLVIYPMIIERGTINFVKTPYGYFFTFKSYPGRKLFMCYVFTIFILGIFISFHGFQSSKRKRQRKMAVSTFVCLGVFALGMVFDIIIPLFGIASFPASAFAQFISVLLVYMVSLRYNVSRMTVANVSEYIYTFVKTPIVILDEDEKVQLINSSASEFLSMPVDQVVGKKASSFFKIEKKIPMEGKSDNIVGECRINGAKCDLAINEILDSYGEPLGRLVIVTDMTDKINMIQKLDESRQEAIQANEAKSAFLANMSHEIRTPMNTIIGISEILLKRDLNKEEREEVMLIRNSGNGLLSIINDILDISKIESGKFEIIEGQYMLCSLLVDIINMIAVRLVDKGINFFVRIDPDLPVSLIGDDLRIKQILINIIGNAVKFTKKGYILVEVAGKHTSENTMDLTIRVKDTGIGIRKEDMGKLFGIFNQVDTRKNHNIKGTGLGLAISRNLVSLMNGEITVDSEYGKGTAFTIRVQQKVKSKTSILPEKRRKEIEIVIFEQDDTLIEYFSKTLQELGISYRIYTKEEELQGISSLQYLFIRSMFYEELEQKIGEHVDKEKVVLVMNTGEELTKGRNELHHVALPLFCFQVVNLLNNDHTIYAYGKKEESPAQIKPLPFASVLVVDDNETNLYVAKGMMSAYKMEIDTARSGYDALVLVKKKKYDLIFMDHMMPGIDGIDTTRKIREMDDEYYKKVPIVALTANAMTGARDSFIREGFDDFLAKPIEYKELDRVLCEFVLAHAPKNYKEMLKGLEEGPEIVHKTIDYNLQQLAGRLEDIDMKEKVETFGGNLELYLNVLHTYYEDICVKREELASLWDKRDISSFTISVHALKSASYNVGANKLGKIAELFEHAGKEQDIQWMEHNMRDLLQECDKTADMVGGLLEYVRCGQQKNGGEKEAKEHITREYLKQLKEYCIDMDFTNLEKEMNHIKNSFYEATQQELVDRLITAYEEFEYEELFNIIESYLE